MKSMFRIINVICIALMFSFANAQPLPVPPNALPIIDTADELKGATLVQALRSGGFVMYMRHALQIPPVSDKCIGNSLTPVGEEQARNVGAALGALKIPVGVVHSSEVCRSRDTARLLGLGPYEISADLNPGGMPPGVDIDAARMRQLAQLPPRGTNTVLVSHLHGSIKREAWMHLELAEIIVYRPDGGAGRRRWRG